MADDHIVFRKRARGARDVRKREIDAGADESGSSVVEKKARVAESPAARVPDRFGERTVHATERASGQAQNTNANQDDATRGAHDWDVEDELRHFREAGPADGTYRGLANYAKYTETRDDGSSAKFKSKGPIKAPANVRTITVVDYQPDVCKDYKETGYCGFGDTCKFLHDRSDYLAGWQMNAVGEAADARAGSFGADVESDDDDDDIPFACLLCRQPFTDPVVTKCGHYFCAQCAITRFAKTPKCFACGAKTDGLFQSATRVLERMRRRQTDRAEARAEHRRMHGMDDNELLDGVVVE